MTVTENLMLVAMEECAEIQKEISKSMRFGLNNSHPLRPQETNENNLLTEYYQLQAVVEYMQTHNILSVYSENVVKQIKEEKINNVLKYIDVSINIGTVA